MARNVRAFIGAGGRVAVLHDPLHADVDPTHRALRARLRSPDAAAPDDLGILTACRALQHAVATRCGEDGESVWSRLAIAYDGEGNPVGAIDWCLTRAALFRVGYVGSTQDVPGTGCALEAVVAHDTAGITVRSSALPGAVTFHQKIGRWMSGLDSVWTTSDTRHLARWVPLPPPARRAGPVEIAEVDL